MASRSLASKILPRRWAWLLAFALWLPAAQWAAAAHALVHLHASVKEQRDPASLAPGACDLCVVAAALGSGAPAPAPSIAPVIDLPQAAPVFLPPTRYLAAPARFYASRAPPFLHA